jgi:hypothetical protein
VASYEEQTGRVWLAQTLYTEKPSLRVCASNIISSSGDVMIITSVHADASWIERRNSWISMEHGAAARKRSSLHKPLRDAVAWAAEAEATAA